MTLSICVAVAPELLTDLQPIAQHLAAGQDSPDESSRGEALQEQPTQTLENTENVHIRVGRRHVFFRLAVLTSAGP